MEAILQQLQHVLSEADDAGRKAIVTQVRDLFESYETSNETVNRLGYIPLQLAATRIGYDNGIFRSLVARKGPVDLETLQGEAATESGLFERLMRYMSSVGLITQVDEEHFVANQVTRNLAVEGNEGALKHCFETVLPMFRALPLWLERRGLSGSNITVMQQAFSTQQSAYEWLGSHPQNLHWFNQYMSTRRPDNEGWLALHPVEEETREWPASEAVFVNMGGSIGHQCAEFKMRYPHVPGRVILQDLPQTIAHALPTPGVENMAHDFFTPQPIKNAKYYFLRGVLHNWTDEKVRLILQNIVPSMGPESRILIDDLVLTNKHVHSYVTAMDITMMCALSGIERTRQQWDSLLAAVDLEITEHYYYAPAMCEGVMVVKPKGS